MGADEPAASELYPAVYEFLTQQARAPANRRSLPERPPWGLRPPASLH